MVLMGAAIFGVAALIGMNMGPKGKGKGKGKKVSTRGSQTHTVHAPHSRDVVCSVCAR
jgi:hypothetical protein